MIDIDPNKRPNIYEILKDNFKNNMTFSFIKDEADHLNPMFEKGICCLELNAGKINFYLK